MAKRNWHDRNDTWQQRRERSLVARGRAPAPVERPVRQERVERPRVVYQGWDMYGQQVAQPQVEVQRTGVSSGRWSYTLYGGVSLNSFVEKTPPVVPPKIQPGDLVELINPQPSWQRQFNHWNDNSFVVERSEAVWTESVWVSFLGEATAVNETALRLKDGPW